MIILKHLTAERFRLLQEVNLHFPQRGSILIQGPNEAGKSALFESIYFALYGEPLASDSGRSSHSTVDDLIHYGETNASVTLTLSIGVTELSITRGIERGKEQKVNLYVRRLGMPEEKPITQLDVANERIIAELGDLDGNTLRNSCFIEQKGLTRLENLGRSEREDTLRKLLGLEKLMRLSEQFKLTEQDEQLLYECSQKLKLAEVQTRIPELSQQLGKLEAALDAVTVTEDLAELKQQEAEIVEQEQFLAQVQVKRNEIQGRQHRIAQLKKAETTLGEIIVAYDAIAEAQQELPELERQLAELDLRESEELPELEGRVRELADLTRSFGTLERMAADLLTTISTMKEFEQDLSRQEHLQDDLAELDEDIIHAHLRVEQARQLQYELEEQGRSARPQLEARLQRLQELAQRLTELRQAEEQDRDDKAREALAKEKNAQLQKVQQELQDTEQELKLVKSEAEQAQQQAEALEKQWRQLSIRQQLGEWLRLKRLVQGLTDAEQHLQLAQRQQEQLTTEALAAHRNVTTRMGIFIACTVLFVLSGSAAFVLALQHLYIFATLLGMAALLLGAGAGLSLQNYHKARQKEQSVDSQTQETVNRVSMLVAAREAAVRAAGDPNSLAQVEHEIQALGSTVPRSLDEAQQQISQIGAQFSAPAESLTDMQRQLAEKRAGAMAAHNQVNVTMEAVAKLQNEVARLEEEREQEQAGRPLRVPLQGGAPLLAQLRRQVAAMAGQEGLPIPNFPSSIPEPQNLILVGVGTQSNIGALSTDALPVDALLAIAQLNTLVEDTIQSTEHEIATLQGKLEELPELSIRVKLHQEMLDALFARKNALTEHYQQFQAQHPIQKLERMRQQQVALRNGLRLLQDSLRQRVQSLGVSFGQAAISGAEIIARKQLEALYITLGRRLELQHRRSVYAATLKERQEMLSEHYQQLTKLSGSLGSWIVPPNPFTESLSALRTRCERAMQEERESSIQSEFEGLKIQEGASRAKIELCLQEIEEIQERIAAMLLQRNRPPVKSCTLADIVAVWPLVGEYSSQDRSRLEKERDSIEKELLQMEQEDLALSTRLQTGGSKLDLDQARRRMEQQERSYQTKQRGASLLYAVIDRLLRKILPRTEYYMQQLLPLLTSSRYHDVHLSENGKGFSAEHVAIQRPSEDSRGKIHPASGAFQLDVWEPAASAYIPKSALSGGTADQISLALRLAFAIAALPRELGAAPGFLMLDEPISSFDRDRMQALVDIITGDMLGQHFEQILLISHSSTFEPALFPYHVYIDEGQVIESNLPVVSTASLVEANGHDSNKAMQVPVPASIMMEG